MTDLDSSAHKTWSAALGDKLAKQVPVYNELISPFLFFNKERKGDLDMNDIFNVALIVRLRVDLFYHEHAFDLTKATNTLCKFDFIVETINSTIHSVTNGRYYSLSPIMPRILFVLLIYWETDDRNPIMFEHYKKIAETIRNFLVNRLGFNTKDIDDCVNHVKKELKRAKKQHTSFSTFLVPKANPNVDDIVVQRNYEAAAKSGATALAEYLSSNEGKTHFDFRNLSRPEVLKTINKECGTNIKEDTFYRACTKRNLFF